MIKKVHLKNFESHEDTTVEFTDGLNLLIGGSNQGKSSIIRAIALVAANRFDRDCVRTGSLFCEVTVETEKGSVTAFRGEETNRWVVQKAGGEPKEYRNIGTATPPGAMEVLGIGEREHGGISELPNIMFQLEKHYMLSEIDGKKATANQIARMMDDAIGIGGMEDLIKAMADDFAAYRKEMNLKADEVSLKKGQLLDDGVWGSIEEAVLDMKKASSGVAEVEELLSRAARLTERLDAASPALKRAEEELALLSDALGLARETEARARKAEALERAVRLRDEREARAEEDALISRAIEIHGGCLEKKGRLELLERAQSTLAGIRPIGVAPADIDALQGTLRTLEEKHERIVAATAMLGSARSLYLSAKKEADRFIEAGRRLGEAEGRFAALRKTLKKCPLCGSDLSEKEDR